MVTYAGHSDNVWTVDWSPDGRYIASGSADGAAQVWDAQTGKHVLSYRRPLPPTQPDGWARTVTWSPDSKQLLIGFKDGMAQVLDITNGEVLHIIKGNGPLSSINTAAWSPDGKYIAIGYINGPIRVHELITTNELIYIEHNAPVQSLVWSPDNTRIVSASSDGTVKVWLVANGQTLVNYTNQGDAVMSVSWSHDGTRIASAARDVQVWDAGTGRTLFTYNQHKSTPVLAVAWSHNDAYIASGGADGTRIWEAKTGNRVRNYNTGAIFSLAWSPDDTRIVTASVGTAAQGKVNKVVQVWRVR
jgi:WD40 repeat protein